MKYLLLLGGLWMGWGGPAAAGQAGPRRQFPHFRPTEKRKLQPYKHKTWTYRHKTGRPAAPAPRVPKPGAGR